VDTVEKLDSTRVSPGAIASAGFSVMAPSVWESSALDLAVAGALNTGSDIRRQVQQRPAVHLAADQPVNASRDAREYPAHRASRCGLGAAYATQGISPDMVRLAHADHWLPYTGPADAGEAARCHEG
jgi:hypothetical protein